MKKLYLSLCIFLLAFKFTFASAGLPTFDFSNLISSIESITNAIKFYEESLKQVEAYKGRLEKIGQGLSLDNFEALLSGIKKGEEGSREVKAALGTLRDSMNENSHAIRDLLVGMDNSINDTLGISTSGALRDMGNKIGNNLSYDGLKAKLEKELAAVISLVEEGKQKKTELTDSFNEKKRIFEEDINALKSDIETLSKTSGESQVALQTLNLKTANLSKLESEYFELDSEFKKSLEEIEKNIKTNEREVEKLQAAISNLLGNIRSVAGLEDETKKMQENFKNYKPFQFRFKGD